MRSFSWTSIEPRPIWSSVNDVNQTLSMYVGSLYVNSFNSFGRHWQVTIQADGSYRSRIEELNLLKIRNKTGQMVPLGTVIQMRKSADRHS